MSGGSHVQYAISTAVLAAIVLFSTASSAHAYIDPGSGSVITTAILGFFAAIAYTFRKYFYKLTDMLTGRNKSKNSEGRDDQ